jgi:hypothetical protein
VDSNDSLLKKIKESGKKKQISITAFLLSGFLIIYKYSSSIFQSALPGTDQPIGHRLSLLTVK